MIMNRYGAIEAGGTKFLCAIGNARGEILNRTRIDTVGPDSTIARVLDYFRNAEASVGRITAFGLSTFGPIELRHDSPQYGCITTTPKLEWRNTNILGMLGRELQRPIGLDTDVNGAALAELRWGGGQTLESLAYVTVGTGIGGGVIHRGMPVHGLMHPEMGHISVRRHFADVDFRGVCKYHGDCLEGLACGPAIIARTGCTLQEVREGHLIWDMEADYLGQLCAHLVFMHSPQRIFLGGGVMRYPRLFPAIHDRLLHALNGYLSGAAVCSRDYVSPSSLGDAVGIKGALALALNVVAAP
jgi:fructokinase